MNKDVFLITGSLGVCLGLAVLVIVLVDRARRRADVRERLAEARARVGLVPPALDNVAGVNLADLDACQLILSLPAYDATDHTTTPEGD